MPIGEVPMPTSDDAIALICQRFRAIVLEHSATHLRLAVPESVPAGLMEALQFASVRQRWSAGLVPG